MQEYSSITSKILAHPTHLVTVVESILGQCMRSTR